MSIWIYNEYNFSFKKEVEFLLAKERKLYGMTDKTKKCITKEKLKKISSIGTNMKLLEKLFSNIPDINGIW